MSQDVAGSWRGSRTPAYSGQTGRATYYMIGSSRLFQLNCRGGIVKHLSRCLSLLSLCFGIQLGVVAQTSRGTVTGLVTDPQKAAVANATVELTGNATNVVRRT